MRKTDWRKSEVELGKVVVKYLRDYHWDVYQEVQVEEGGRVADIVGVRGNITWIIECKTSMNLGVIEQASGWKPYGTYISICIPEIHRWNKNARNGVFGKEVCRMFGIGCLELDKLGGVKETVRPELRRWADSKDLISRLCEEQKTWALAGAKGGHFTPFKLTCKLIRNYVRQNQGCKLREVIDSIKHHYASPASAYSSLKKLIEENIIKGVYFGYVNKELRVFVDEDFVEEL